MRGRVIPTPPYLDYSGVPDDILRGLAHLWGLEDWENKLADALPSEREIARLKLAAINAEITRRHNEG